MMTRDQLAALLTGVSVAAVSKESQLSTKTIYRLRHKKHSPTLDTVERLVHAVSRVKAKRKRAAVNSTAAA